MQNETRRLELSDKLKQMGHALLKEGTTNNDFTVAQSGTIMILTSTLLLSDEDMFIFSELCSMFSAKKILDEQENIDPIEKEIFKNLLAKKKMEAEAKKNAEAPKKRRGGRKPKDGDSETK